MSNDVKAMGGMVLLLLWGAIIIMLCTGVMGGCNLPGAKDPDVAIWQSDCRSVNCVNADYYSYGSMPICQWDCASLGDGIAHSLTLVWSIDECGCYELEVLDVMDDNCY